MKVVSKLLKVKANSGITLVALIVTVIVLIILAGISINLVLGDNGILKLTKKAKENYTIAANEEIAMLGTISRQIESDNTDGNINNNPKDETDNGEYFFQSYNGFTNIIGTGRINSLYGLMPITYEPSEEDSNGWNEAGWNHCLYEKKLDSPFDLSREFEISLKSRFVTSSSTQVGCIFIYLQKLNNENNYDDIIKIQIGDFWQGRSSIETFIEYNQENIYDITETGNQKFNIGIIGDGTNIKVYNDSTLLTTAEQQANLSFDRIIIEFVQHETYPVIDNCYVERLYFGDIKYYKDII